MNLASHNLFDLVSPHIPGTSAGTVVNITIRRRTLSLNLSSNRTTRAVRELTAATQSREAMTSARWVTGVIDTAGPSDTIAAPVAQLFIMHKGLVLCLLCSLFNSLPPPSLLTSENRKPPPPSSSLLLLLLPPPPPPPLEFAGSLVKHGNDIINRKKRTGWKREKASEREWEREREYSEYSEVLCYSHIRLSAPTLHSSTRDGPAIPPALPSCPPAAVQSYEVVMSLVVTSLTMNPTSNGLGKKETSQWKHFVPLFFFFFQLHMPQHAFELCAL